ncbi:MAG TPA: hypothetical protein VGX28_14415 [Frankiaceae bacterium]|jgi:hypothetical protein|nr:hypothetical protein [Frankiaceae bacterium]
MRRLTLRAERLAELADGDLAAVHAASHLALHCYASNVDVTNCLGPATFGCTGLLPSVNVRCPSLDRACW